MRLQLFLLGAWYPHLYSVHIINVLTVKIIGFCNIQFICPVPHEKSLTLPNWFCLSFSPLRGPALLMPWYDMTTAQLNICTLSLSSFLLQRRKMAGGSPLNVRSSYHGLGLEFLCWSNKHCKQELCRVTAHSPCPRPATTNASKYQLSRQPRPPAPSLHWDWYWATNVRAARQIHPQISVHLRLAPLLLLFTLLSNIVSSEKLSTIKTVE